MISDDERESLHFALDAILNARATLERKDAADLTGQERYRTVVQPRADLFKNASKFLRRAVGPVLHRQEMALLFDANLTEDADSADLTATLANSLRSFIPLFMERGDSEWSESEEPIVKIIDDLMGIYWGDEPRFFSTGRRLQGMHKRPYRLARLRLTALDWDKYLATVGQTAFERHRVISEAYRTDWEAIRKWAKSIEEQFGLCSYPPKYPDHAKSEFAENSKKVWGAIRRDGDAYWLERGTAATGKSR